MANPTVDKLKTLGLRFADKVAVALTAVLCLVFVFLALNKETIETTPDQLGEIANRAQQNINNPQDEKAILSKIEEDGMVLQGFGPKVASRENTKVDVRQFSLTRSFVKAEPGAGLIRDSVQKDLLAPYELVATAGRGGIPFAARDEAGNLLPPDPEEQKKQLSGMFSGRGSGMMSGGMPGMSGSAGGTAKKNVRQEQLAKQQENIASTKKKAGIAGSVEAPPPEEEEDASAQLVDYKTEIRGQRWVAIVGLLNNKQFRERYARALKVPEDSPESHPDYKRIEMERQSYDPVAGDWSEWALVDPTGLDKLTEDIAFEEDPSFEMTPEPTRLPPLVDFLPYLASGYWTGVHHGQLIPAETLRELLAEEEEEPAMNNMAMMGERGMGSTMMGSGMMGSGMMGSGGMMGEGMMMGGRGMGSGMMGSGMMGSGMMGMGMMGRPSGSGPEHMTDEEIVMVRGLDFTVNPDTTYRYRVRVVVGNPNYNREDVAPGVDPEAREFAGPWSDPTESIKVPADVSLYAMSPAGQAYRPETVNFDVVAWNEKSGSLAVGNFPVAPGEFVGRPKQVDVPVEGEDKPKAETINFQSRELVVDTVGGQKGVQNLSVGGRPLTGGFELPAVVAVLRPDGTIAMHNQAVDATDEQRAFMRESYFLSISNELNKKERGNAMGSMMGGMMGGMGSGMMGGY